MKTLDKTCCRTWCQRALYLVILVGLLIALAYEVALCIIKYVEEPTYYETHIERQSDTKFPDITLCPYFDNIVCLDPDVKRILRSKEWSSEIRVSSGTIGELGKTTGMSGLSNLIFYNLAFIKRVDFEK